MRMTTMLMPAFMRPRRFVLRRRYSIRLKLKVRDKIRRIILG